jgi:hypothetical protein
MLKLLIRSRIENFTPILVAWFLETRAWTHLNHGCRVEHVLLDLMACLSGAISGLKSGDEEEALERVRSKVNSRGTCKLIEDLAALIPVWRHDGEVFRHLHCEYESCAFY